MARRSLGAYKKVQANTASPGQRVVMVYEGIRKSLKQAIDAINSKEPEGISIANSQIHLAEQLISELKNALDMRAGEVSVTLNDLYEFWLRHLTEANTTKDAQKAEEVKEMVEGLLEAWKEAVRKV
jgi:flagellar protein FliS